jgi:hypothetical protein
MLGTLVELLLVLLSLAHAGRVLLKFGRRVECPATVDAREGGMASAVVLR